MLGNFEKILEIFGESSIEKLNFKLFLEKLLLKIVFEKILEIFGESSIEKLNFKLFLEKFLLKIVFGNHNFSTFFDFVGDFPPFTPWLRPCW